MSRRKFRARRRAGLERYVQITITKDTTTTKFRYAPDGSRYLQYTVTSSAKTATYYVDKLAEHVTSTNISSGAQTDADRSYVGSAVVIAYAAGTGRAVNYLHPDRLGSVQTITDPSAAEVMTDAHGMDAFGKPRDREWMDNGSKLHPNGGGVTNHGFTGHEHLDDTYLIHMNGRVYDYRLGRFLSVDPIISNPANSQSINPYSYIGNNPLSGTDPTGYCAVGTTMVTGSNICTKVSELDKPLTNNVSLGTNHIFADGSTIPRFQSGASAQTAQTSTANPAQVNSTTETGRQLQTAGDMGRGLDDFSTRIDRSLLGDARRSFAPLNAPGDVIRMAGDELKIGEGISGAIYDPTLSTGMRILGVVQDLARATILLGPVIRAAAEGFQVAESAMARGLVSEARVLQDMGFAKNTSAVVTSEGRSIADALTRALSVEIKDSASVSLTRQLRIQTGAAADAGRQSILVTGQNTRVSGPAQEAFDQIIRRSDLEPR